VEAQSAVSIGVQEIHRLAELARHRLRASGQPTLLLLDEIYLLNRMQQDALLDYLRRRYLHLGRGDHREPFLHSLQRAAFASAGADALTRRRKRRYACWSSVRYMSKSAGWVL
jgi:hypothetical protein